MDFWILLLSPFTRWDPFSMPVFNPTNLCRATFRGIDPRTFYPVFMRCKCKYSLTTLCVNTFYLYCEHCYAPMCYRLVSNPSRQTDEGLCPKRFASCYSVKDSFKLPHEPSRVHLFTWSRIRRSTHILPDLYKKRKCYNYINTRGWVSIAHPTHSYKCSTPS